MVSRHCFPTCVPRQPPSTASACYQATPTLTACLQNPTFVLAFVQHLETLASPSSGAHCWNCHLHAKLPPRSQVDTFLQNSPASFRQPPDHSHGFRVTTLLLTKPPLTSTMLFQSQQCSSESILSTSKR
jgi:hypothetical protein